MLFFLFSLFEFNFIYCRTAMGRKWCMRQRGLEYTIICAYLSEKVQKERERYMVAVGVLCKRRMLNPFTWYAEDLFLRSFGNDTLFFKRYSIPHTHSHIHMYTLCEIDEPSLLLCVIWVRRSITGRRAGGERRGPVHFIHETVSSAQQSIVDALCIHI